VELVKSEMNRKEVSYFRLLQQLCAGGVGVLYHSSNFLHS